MEKILKFYQIFLKFISPFIVAFFAYYKSSSSLIEFTVVPEEQLLNLNIVFYSTIAIGFFSLIELILVSLKNGTTKIKVSISDNKDKFLHNDLDLNFQSDVCAIFIKVILSGNPKKLMKQSVNIIFPTQVQVQLGTNSNRYCVLDDSNQIVKIKLDTIINTNKKERISGDSAVVSLIVSKIDEKVGGHIETSFENKPKFVKLSKNKVYLDQ